MLELIKPFNFILAADAYKADHFLELPPEAAHTYSVIVPRKPSKYSKKVVAMGQTFVSFIMSQVRITHDMIDEAEIEINEQGYTFNRKGWERIVDELDGKLPLAVFAVEEGRIVSPQTPIMGILDTHEGFGWLPPYVETWVQGTVWKMSTVASRMRVARHIVREFMVNTGSDMSMLDWKIHNFGDRAAGSPEEGPVMAGMAHAALFNGSDCLRVNGYIKRLYNTKKAYTSSVEATEHFAMCANSDATTKDDFGAAVMLVERLKAVVERSKNGIGIPVLSGVIDTYDSRRFVRDYLGGVLKDEIINSGGKLVARPDSGDPTVEPSMVAADFEATFGLAGRTSTGHKDLHTAVGILQGDGIRLETIFDVLVGFTGAGYSMNNFLLGMGSGVTHDGARDDFSFSMKAVAMHNGVKWVRMLKEPNTDLSKTSLSGLVRCVENPYGELSVVDMTDEPEEFMIPGPGWQLWYIDGSKPNKQSFDEVQERARQL